MILPSRLRIDPPARHALVAVASGSEPADLALTGGLVLNVFTGRVAPAAVGISGGRIAWVGEAPAPAREELDLGGRTVVPGLIDAHCHVDMLCTPTAFIQNAAAKGTTTAVVDTHKLTTWLGDDALDEVFAVLEDLPMKVLWGVRPSGDRGGADDDPQLPAGRLARLATRVGVAGAGEVTSWRALLAGDERIGSFVGTVTDAGLNVDAHAPGASARTLARLAAAGLTSDHEAITGDELAARVEVGLWTMLRHSSLRADGVLLARAVVERGLPVDRIMLTADGVIPRDLVHGHVDTVVRRVVEGGVAPADAVRMATLHPATYLGLDAHVGSVAPGRCADLAIVDDLATFTVERVLCDGALVDPEAPLDERIDWAAMTIPMHEGPVTARAIVDACEAAPPIRMGGVIPRLDERPAEEAGGPRSYVAVVGRDGRTIAGTTTRDFDVHAVATSVTGTTDILLIGRDPAAMAHAYGRVVRARGGLASADTTLALPTFGALRPGRMEVLAREFAAFEADAGLPGGGPPFTYRSMFLTMPALPGICLTKDGLLDVRADRRLTEATAL